MTTLKCRFIPPAEAESVISSNGSALPSRTSISDVTGPSARKAASDAANTVAQPSLADRKKSEELKPSVKVGFPFQM